MEGRGHKCLILCRDAWSWILFPQSPYTSYPGAPFSLDIARKANIRVSLGEHHTEEHPLIEKSNQPCWPRIFSIFDFMYIYLDLLCFGVLLILQRAIKCWLRPSLCPGNISLDVIPMYYLYDKFWKWYRGFPQIWGWVKCSRLLWTIIHCFLTFWISLSSECPVPQSRDKGLSKKVDRVVAQMESTVKEMTLKWPRT